MIGTYQIRAKNGDVFRLLKVRNPWSNDGSYIGKWNDKDEIW